MWKFAAERVSESPLGSQHRAAQRCMQTKQMTIWAITIVSGNLKPKTEIIHLL